MGRAGILAAMLMAALLLFAGAGKVEAARFSGEYLMKICGLDRQGNETIKGGQIACQAYISGVIDYHNMMKSMNLIGEMNFCIPESETLNEIQLRVLKYFYEHSSLHRKFLAAPGVAMALFSAYPCKK